MPCGFQKVVMVCAFYYFWFSEYRFATLNYWKQNIMNYTQFSNKVHIQEKILTKLGILTKEELIIRINNHPDYNLTKYKKEIVSDYFFHNSWDYSEKFNSIIDVCILRNDIFHFDTLQTLSQQYRIEFNEKTDNCDFLLQVQKKDNEAFVKYGFRTEVNDFILHRIKIRSIDNLKKCIYYEGSFQGDSSDIEPLDWGVYSTLKVTAVPKKIDTQPFYKLLIAESFLLLIENKFKLSYFLTFSAFESFVNYELGGNEEPVRLKDKLKELFCNKFNALGRNQIYTSVMSMYDTYETNRNSIAHGRNELIIDAEQVRISLLFILTLISSFEFNISTFDVLLNKIEK